MFKFLRRLFIILVLLAIVFVVYRYINPSGADIVVDKVKSVPTTISSRFSKDDSDLILDSKTISLHGDIQTGDIYEKNLEADDEDKNLEEDDKDKLWLETLNKEIESILGKDKEEVVINETILIDAQKVTEITGFDSINIETSTGTDTIVFIETTTGIEKKKESSNSGNKLVEEKQNETIVTSTVTETTSTAKNTSTKTTNKLTSYDYQQIKNVFGNLFK